MKIGQVCNRDVVVILKSQSVREAAERMREDHVGDLVIVEQRGAHLVPVGVLTDRDIVVGLIAKDVEHLRSLGVGDLVTRELLTAREDEDVERVLGRMQHHGVRRMPVVNDAGVLVGIFTVDDVLGLISGDLAAVVALIGRERRSEIERRP